VLKTASFCWSLVGRRATNGQGPRVRHRDQPRLVAPDGDGAALAQMQRISPLAPTAGLWIGAVLLQCKWKAPVNHIAGGTRQTGLYSEASKWRHFFF
jgi:hypothetical protein